MRENNTFNLAGRITSPIVHSFTNRYNEKFYTFTLGISRNSGVYDEVPIICPQDIGEKVIKDGYKNVAIIGDIRTRNNYSGVGAKLIIEVFAESISPMPEGDFNLNDGKLVGFICRQPVYRITPAGKEICDTFIAVNRNTHKADYIPCIFWGRMARKVSNMNVGTEVEVAGRFQSRKYTKVIGDESIEKTAYEVSSNTVKEVVHEVETN